MISYYTIYILLCVILYIIIHMFYTILYYTYTILYYTILPWNIMFHVYPQIFQGRMLAPGCTHNGSALCMAQYHNEARAQGGTASSSRLGH